ncbi:MAG: crossover junction endodeoxyribonuclease RuvC [Elusimicrobia bacterium]|nr:crossover junction endodeoxyribonuclease RuvC [Elusimicrobiota bacterium]
MNPSKKILGIDPGLDRIGWAVLSSAGGGQAVLISSGLVHTSKEMPLPRRLEIIFRETSKIIEKESPDCGAMEEVFFMKRAASVSATIEARGVLLLACRLGGLEITSYDPRKVKVTLTGNGSADKLQMQKMIKLTLGLAEIPKPDDVADAMAVALCHIKLGPLAEKIKTALARQSIN